MPRSSWRLLCDSRDHQFLPRGSRRGYLSDGTRMRGAAMTEPGLTRVAVYIDFDNIVISRYDQLHGRGQFQRDKVRGFDAADRSADPEITDKLRRATVDVGAVIDFA